MKLYNVKTALQISGLDWEVKKEQLELPNPDGTRTLIPNVYGVVRQTDRTVLSTVTKRYEVFQNWEAFKFYEDFIGENKYFISEALSFNDGRQIGIQIKSDVDDNIREIVKGDTIDGTYILVASHDKSYSTTILQTSKRFLCLNILNSKDVLQGLIGRIRHSSKQRDKLEELKEVVKFQQQEFDLTVNSYRAMANKPMDTEQFRSYLERVFASELNTAAKRSDNPDKFKLEDYRPTKLMLWNHSTAPDLQIEGVVGTTWAGFNAITQYVTHQKGGKDAQRLDKIYLGNDARLLEKCAKFALR